MHTLLEIVLFSVYFVVVSLLITPDTTKATHNNAVNRVHQTALPTTIVLSEELAILLQDIPDISSYAEEAIKEKIQQENKQRVTSITPTEGVQNQAPENLFEDLDIEHLKLRPARKIASRLGIAQKVNGKDQPLKWLRSQIQKRLREEPEKVATIISEVLVA
ncbi:MAG: hypothetical protein F6K09_08780 [Merismopedia sp. SIO2A8]|nr:hypothetical protein [Symploca sp. SIO2B6]NET48805.1 hypothetical protein [Merismopedia sp. SIO2A8]